MGKQLGIWIDKTEANLIWLEGETVSTTTIASGIDTRERIEGEGNNQGRFGDQYVDPEKSMRRRRDQQQADYLQKVQETSSDADEIVVFGPAQMKTHLSKLLSASKLKGVEAADSMTDNQKVAWVKDFFKSDGD